MLELGPGAGALTQVGCFRRMRRGYRGSSVWERPVWLKWREGCLWGGVCVCVELGTVLPTPKLLPRHRPITTRFELL